MITFKYPVFLVLIIIMAGSCGKIEHLSPVPSIEFTSFEVRDTIDPLGNDARAGILKFYFEDGDGNIGLREPTGEESDTNNLFLTLYRKVNGVMTPAPANDPLKPSDYRIPYMERLGQNKIIKGEIAVTLLYLFYSENDTIRYDFYLKDRDKNESNTATTCEIVLTDDGICLK
jgi:hypothetical protein